MSNANDNLQTLTQQYNVILMQYQQTYENYINALNASVNSETTTSTSFTSSAEAQQYQQQLQELNNQLIVINKQILVVIQTTPNQINNVNSQHKIQEYDLKNNHEILMSERDKINNIVNQYKSIDKDIEYTNEVATSYYSRYIVLLFITILLFLLLFRYSAVSNERQYGGGNTFKFDAIFLLSIMTIFLGLADIFSYLNILIFLSIVISIYFIIKTKHINGL
jgi:hypothetical protein